MVASQRCYKKVTNTLPKLELQLHRAQGMNYFSSFDLLSGFDYLRCDKAVGRLFTFVNSWGVAYSFKGAPQGWCNTPALFSMRQIHQVLTPVGLWPKNSIQWIGDTVLMSPTFEGLLKILEKYLKQIQARNLRINIQKCSFIDNKATFCERVLNGK
eukprot:snap_masked-scaffold_143-processed-gene-0.1-mRNA-1 protein AED:1.00 eAED:1.00 QI:0/0/0/0/1/1/2/0/155